MLRNVIIVFVLLTCACSGRIEYEHPVSTAVPGALNINTASVDDLEKLPNVGRKTAEAIIRFRSEHGHFRRVEHLLLIRGVSEQRFNAMQPLIRAE